MWIQYEDETKMKKIWKWGRRLWLEFYTCSLLTWLGEKSVVIINCMKMNNNQ